MKFNLNFFLLFNCFVCSSFIGDTLSYNLKVIVPINNKNLKIISCCYMNIYHNDDYNGNIPFSMKFNKNQILQMSNINDDDYDLIDKNDYVVDNNIQNDIYSIELNELFHQKQPKQQVRQQLHEKNDIIASYILSTLFILSTIIISTSIKVVHASTTTTLFENINKISLSTSSSPLSLISLPNAPSDIFNPLNFQPVCPASDNFYQLLKSIINVIIGSENIVEYGPLIASVLLRVRLELCVFESFLYEAVIPFIKVKGITWILPLHETLETFIAGTIFAISSNFILVGSTKIFSIVLLYIDALIGMMMMMVLTHFYPYHNLHHYNLHQYHHNLICHHYLHHL